MNSTSRSSVFVLAHAILAAFVAGATADEIRRWRDAEGKLHVEIVGSGEPVDADAEGLPLLSTSDPSPEEKFSVEASRRRSAIEKRLKKIGAELAAIREDLRETRESEMLVYAPALEENPKNPQFVVDAQRNAFLAAERFRREKADRLRVLRRDERDRLRELRDLWDEFAALHSEVAHRYDGLPGWWRDRLDCAPCPSAEEVETALRPRRREPTPVPTEPAE